MSSQELSKEIDYDTSLNVIDSSLNLFNTDYKKFLKMVFVTFIGIFIWGILGTSCIFWLRYAATTYVQTNKEQCYVNGGDSTSTDNKKRIPFNFIDLYYPQDKNKLPYELPAGCEGLKSSATIPKIQNVNCENPLNFLKSNNPGSISLVNEVDFPYNFFNILKLQKELDTTQDINKEKSFLTKFWIFIKLIFSSAILSNIIRGRGAINGFLYNFNLKRQWPTWIIMILAKLFLGFMLFYKFTCSLLYPIYDIFNVMFDKKYNINPYFFKLTGNSINWVIKLFESDKSGSILSVFLKIIYILLALLIIPITLLVDLPGTLFWMLTILLLLLIVIFISFIMSILGIFMQLFKIFEGGFKSGKFTQIFGCNINLLITLFGAFIIIIASKTLDTTTTSFMGASYGLYIFYQLFKFFT